MRRAKLDVALVTADTANDLAQGRKWFAEASNEALLAVWMRIQQPDADDIAAIVSRLAQVKFSELYLELPS